MKTIVPFLILLSAMTHVGCSSAVEITTTRFSGIVLDTSMVVQVGQISGEGSAAFRSDLEDAIRSSPLGSRPSAGRPYATLVIEGYYDRGYHESSEEETVDGETRTYVDQTFAARLEYVIVHEETGEDVIDGVLEETSSRRVEESAGFFEAIFDAIMRAIFLPDPHEELQSTIVERLVREISPHEQVTTVTLFEDSRMPELEEGVRLARIGRWKESLELFLNAIDRHEGYKELHKAYFDAGVAYEYTHQYSLAREFIEQALSLSYQEEYEAELYRCRRYEQEWKWREEYLERIRTRMTNDKL